MTVLNEVIALDILETYQVGGWLDFLVSLFAAVPAGFALGMLVGLLSFGVFGLLRMLGRFAGGSR